MDKISDNKQILHIQMSLLSLQRNNDVLAAIDKAIGAPQQDSVEISPEAQERLEIDAMQAVLLDGGAAPNELSDIQYVRMSKKPIA